MAEIKFLRGSSSSWNGVEPKIESYFYLVSNEDGSIDVKDLITFYEVIRKGNFSYIESIDTPISIGDKYIKELFLIV